LATCLVLFVFKYFNFFNINFIRIAEFWGWNYPVGALKLILPIGLSFHTFQSLSYVIEVYKGRQRVERNLGIYAVYVMFYPQLVAGPIERPQNLLHQFYEKHDFDYERVTSGLRLMLWGFFKKLVIADQLAVYVNQMYNSPSDFSSGQLLMATYFFAFQIFCDFSGYSDIARGSARVMGFKLMLNFDRPYFSKSIGEFWHRWHISLSTWFRDYLYISLGGNRVKKWRWYYNLFVVFLISGLWHGANWTFVIWGGLHGFYLVFSIWTSRIREKIRDLLGLSSHPLVQKVVQGLVTFHLVLFAWIFFRAGSLTDALFIIKKIVMGITATPHWAGSLWVPGYSRGYFFIVMAALLVMETIHFIQCKKNIVHIIAQKPRWVRWVVYYCLIFGIIFFGNFGEMDFIYFQF
jgi:D-alanyl-lipoteichoic acid acyltransferase DltB (MBOAT superfamily)